MSAFVSSLYGVGALEVPVLTLELKEKQYKLAQGINNGELNPREQTPLDIRKTLQGYAIRMRNFKFLND
jgi:hypothetical protein